MHELLILDLNDIGLYAEKGLLIAMSAVFYKKKVQKYQLYALICHENSPLIAKFLLREAAFIAVGGSSTIRMKLKIIEKLFAKSRNFTKLHHELKLKDLLQVIMQQVTLLRYLIINAKLHQQIKLLLPLKKLYLKLQQV